MKLILTRHGRTIENDKSLLQGHLPGKLSRLGVSQAKKLAGSVFEMPKIKNTAVYMIEINEKMKGKIILENCTKHLYP